MRAYPLDVTDPGAFERQVARVVDDFGRLDVAVNNAGMGGEMVPLADYPLATWDRVMSVNVSSVFYGMRAQIPPMVKQGRGAIVNVASIMACVAMPTIAPYVASKHAVAGLTRGAALDYGPAGVRINAVGPSFVRTGFTAASLPDDETWKHRRLSLGDAMSELIRRGPRRVSVSLLPRPPRCGGASPCCPRVICWCWPCITADAWSPSIGRSPCPAYRGHRPPICTCCSGPALHADAAGMIR